MDENTKLLERLHFIIKELTLHAKEPNCQHRISQFLEELEFRNDES
jgi:hypothetical protein